MSNFVNNKLKYFLNWLTVNKTSFQKKYVRFYKKLKNKFLTNFSFFNIKIFKIILQITLLTDSEYLTYNADIKYNEIFFMSISC